MKLLGKDNQNRTTEFDVGDISGVSAKEIVSLITYGENISALKFIYIGSDGFAYLASSDSTYEISRAVGITLESGSSGEEKSYLLFGKLSDSFFTFTQNQDLYLGINGEATIVPPSSGYVVSLGQSLDTGSIFVGIEKPIAI